MFIIFIYSSYCRKAFDMDNDNTEIENDAYHVFFVIGYYFKTEGLAMDAPTYLYVNILYLSMIYFLNFPVFTHWQNKKNNGKLWGANGLALLKVTENTLKKIADEVYEITAKRQ